MGTETIRISADTKLTSPERHYGLDGLRGFAMLTGILLHASLPYFSRTAGLEFIWPADDDQSLNLFLLFDFIHTWRMPTFFLLAGFFAHLVLARRPVLLFVSDRLRRIALPLLLFGPVFALLFPIIWGYGWSGSLSVEVSVESFRKILNLESSGGIIGHLWVPLLPITYVCLASLNQACEQVETTFLVNLSCMELLPLIGGLYKRTRTI